MMKEGMDGQMKERMNTCMDRQLRRWREERMDDG